MLCVSVACHQPCGAVASACEACALHAGFVLPFTLVALHGNCRQSQTGQGVQGRARAGACKNPTRLVLYKLNVACH